jgi:dienelactone hydrolase
MNQKLKRLFIFVSAASIVCSLQLFSQDQPEKRPFTIDDYGRWRSIVSTALSANGQWMTYGYRVERGDDEFYVKSLTTDKVYEIPRGQNPQFSDDSRWVAYAIVLPWKEAEKLQKEKKPVPQQAGLLDLQRGEKSSWDNIDSFSFSKSSSFLALKKPKADSKAEHGGTDLILHSLNKGTDQNLGNVGNYQFNKSGTHMSYTIDAQDRAGNGLHLIHLETGKIEALDSALADYAHLTWDEEGTALAVLRGKERDGFTEKENSLIAFIGVGTDNPAKVEYDPSSDPNFPENMVISEKAASQGRSRGGVSSRGPLFWSENNTGIFCGIKEQVKEPEKKKEDEDPVADVDVWHWNDEVLQSVQMKRAARDRNFTYRSVYNIDSKRFIRLADEKMRDVDITKSGEWGIGSDEKAYVSDWEERQADYYRIETATGDRTLMFKAQKQTLGLSPDSQHFLYWKDGHVWDYVISSGQVTNLTQDAPVSFVNEEFDHPGTKPPYGVTGWTKDGRSVVLTHRYDLWLQPLEGRPATNLTGGIGSREEIRFRYVRTDPEEEFIDLTKPLLLSAYGQWTKKAGYFSLEKGELHELVYAEKNFGGLSKAKSADIYMYTREDYREFPNYMISDHTFKNARKMTDANPLQSEYKWGYNILIEYTNKNGVRLQGVLSVPDDYQEGQKLPMLVDFYEKNSQNLYRFSRLIYRDTPMFYKYVSNGYLVLLPDVHFNTRTTHSDMLDCVEAAVKKVIEMGYADPKRIGLHGHSFSGQGAAHIATRSKMFAAIVAGAAATDLVSDFNQLWKSSGTNQHQYDYYGQGRFGTNPFDDLELYINESAVFHARTMDTPLLLLHGTDDGSVEWLQAIEFYNALRFNGKNVILLSYPGQDHHATKLENKIDFQIRMEQFYDHYLKGKEAPDWMVNGVPFLKKESTDTGNR